MADTVSQRGESRKAIPKLSHPVDLSKAVDEKLLVERVFVVRADELEENAERIIPVVFSTEFEYVQWFGREMLSHDSDAVDLTRMMNKTAPGASEPQTRSPNRCSRGFPDSQSSRLCQPEIQQRCYWRGDLSGRAGRNQVTDFMRI